MFFRNRKILFLIVAFVFMCNFPARAHVRNIQDNFQIVYHVSDNNGDHVSGQTVTLKIKKSSNGNWYDFSDNTFKASGWTNKSVNMTEDSTEGFYYYTFDPPASETGPEQYQFLADNASATYGDHQSLTVTYQNLAAAPSAGTIADAVWDEAIADHLSAGSTGNKLNAAGNAGDPWAIDVSTGYAGKAGEYLRNVKDATDGDKEGANYTGIEQMVRKHGR